MRTALTFTIATLLAATAAPTGRAELITFMFSGEVAEIDDPNALLTGIVSIGTPFSGQYTFESTTPDAASPTGLGKYLGAIISISGEIGGLPFVGPGDGTNSISILNSFPGSPDSYLVSGRASFLSETVPVGIYLADYGGNAFASDALPLAPLDLGLFNVASFSIGHEAFVSVGGWIVQLTPEPGTLLLAVIGCAGLSIRRRRATKA